MSYEYKPKYISPRGPGKPPKRTGEELIINDFWVGVNTFFDSTNIPESCRLSFNTRCYEGTSLDRRLGYVAFPSLGDAGQVYAQMCLHQSATGQDIFLRLVDGAGAGVQLEKYNWTTELWVGVGNNIGDATSRIDWSWTYALIENEDRVYFTNGVDDLQYTDGSTVSSVAGIKAKYIAAKGPRLVIGHITETHAANDFAWSAAKSHQFFEDGEDYPTSSRLSGVDAPITQIKVFNSLVYAFTEADGLFESDITNIPDPRQISTHGTMSPKTVAIGEDCMVWADQYGVWQLPMGGDITKISKSVDKIYENVTAANYYQMAGGFNSKGQYELHVGDLTFEGEAHSDLVFIYEVEQSRFYGRNMWRLDEDKFFANNIITIADNYGFLHTYYGDRYSQTTYQTDAGAYDNGTEDVEMTWVSKDFPLMSENFEFTAGDIYLRYTPLGLDEIPIILYARTDTETWRLVGNFNLPVGEGPVKMVRLPALKGLTGHTLGLKLVSLSSLEFSLKQILVTYTHNDSQLNLLVPISV